MESHTSRGAATYEFIPGNFGGRNLRDIVHVTTNSLFLKFRQEMETSIPAVIDVSQRDIDERYYDVETGALLPTLVTANPLRALENYQDKHLVIHYPRPHHPFVEPYGKRVFPHKSGSLHEVLQQAPEVLPVKFRSAYREYLDIILIQVKYLLEDCRA